jgi:hypothetical protein
VTPASVNGTTLSLSVEHFTAGGAGRGTSGGFTSQLSQIISELPPTLPLTQVRFLVGQLLGWLANDPFLNLCLATTICEQVITIARDSYNLHYAQTQAAAQAQLANGNPFNALDSLRVLVDVAIRQVEMRELAERAGVPGFNLTIDVQPLGELLTGIAELTRDQLLVDPDTDRLKHLLVVASYAQELGLVDHSAETLGLLVEVLDAFLARTTAEDGLCDTDPEAGEALLRIPLESLFFQGLEAIRTGFYNQFTEAFQGCRVRIEPRHPVVAANGTVQLSGFVVGVPSSFLRWSVEAPGASSIDFATGLFTAGSNAGAVTVVATNFPNPDYTKRVIVHIITVDVTPKDAKVKSGESKQFTASVAGGAPDAPVTWSLPGAPAGHSIDANGRFTAGATLGTVTVRATTVAPPHAVGEATVEVIAGALDPNARLVGRISIVVSYVKAIRSLTSTTIASGDMRGAAYTRDDRSTEFSESSTDVDIDVVVPRAGGTVILIPTAIQGMFRDSFQRTDRRRWVFSDCTTEHVATGAYTLSADGGLDQPILFFGRLVLGPANSYRLEAGSGARVSGETRSVVNVQTNCPFPRDLAGGLTGEFTGQFARSSFADGSTSLGGGAGTYVPGQRLSLSGSNNWTSDCSPLADDVDCTKTISVTWQLDEP